MRAITAAAMLVPLAAACAQPCRPVIVGAVEVGPANDIIVIGRLAYVAAGEAGLKIVDVTDPATPMLVGSVPTRGEVHGVDVQHARAYLASGSAGLEIFDISNLAAPVHLGGITLPGPCTDVIVGGNRAYVAAGDKGVYLLEVSDPQAVVITGSYDTPGTATSLATDRLSLFVADVEGGLQIINIRDLFNPVLLAQVGPEQVTDVIRYPGDLVVCSYCPEGGLLLLDTDDPAMPVRLGQASAPGCGLGLGVPKGIGPVRDVAAVASERTLALFDTGDPANPRFLGNVAIPTTPTSRVEDAVVLLNLAYVAGGDDKLHIVDYSSCLSSSCYADCDGSGSLDVFDYGCFGQAFLMMDPYTDCTGEGVFDIFDFICFQDAFVVGCP